MLILLVGLAGGVALGSMAAARRTASSFTTFLDASKFVGSHDRAAGDGPGVGQPHLAQRLEAAVRKYPQVTHVESYQALDASLVRSGKATGSSLDGDVLLVSSVDGLLFNQDRFAITSGRMAVPSRADEVVITQTAATALGLHVGSGLCPSSIRPWGAGTSGAVALKVVGIGLLNREVVQDQIARFPTYIVGTRRSPARWRPTARHSCISARQLRGGSTDVAAVDGDGTRPRATSPTSRCFAVQTEAQQAIRPRPLPLASSGPSPPWLRCSSGSSDRTPTECAGQDLSSCAGRRRRPGDHGA